MKASAPPRILRRGTASEEGEQAPGSAQPNETHLQLLSTKEQQCQPDQGSRSPRIGSRASTEPVSANEKLLLEVMDTLWMVCSALAGLGQPDDIAGLHAITGSAFSKLSSPILR